MKSAVVVAVAVCIAAAFGNVVGYKVEPVKAAWSGWTAYLEPNNYVSQVLTINFDELDSTTGSYVELFAGTKGGGGAYHVSVKTWPGGAGIATGSHDGDVDHEWVRFNLHVTQPESIVKGKKLEFCFARGGGDSPTA